jgi:hypothetical protein
MPYPEKGLEFLRILYCELILTTAGLAFRTAFTTLFSRVSIPQKPFCQAMKKIIKIAIPEHVKSFFSIDWYNDRAISTRFHNEG